jgi:hypothetical protein
MKVPLSKLWSNHGIFITAYLDDLLIIGQTPLAVLNATHLAQEMIRSLGFTISLSKSVIHPCRNITFLGFDLDSVSMTVSTPHTKAAALKP